MKIYSRLRELVNAESLELGRRVSQAEIARKTGIRQGTISLWMRNKRPLRRIDTAALFSLSKYFDCEPFDLLKIDKK